MRPKAMTEKYPGNAVIAESLKMKKVRQEPSFANFLTATPKGISRRLHRKQTAEFLGVSLSWLDKARITGTGPMFISIGGRVLYDTRDLEAYIRDHRHSSTSEQY
jgi:hypothetical protein